MLSSKFRYYKINADSHFQWHEKEKLPKPVIYVDIKNVYVDRNYVENFEWQLKMSRMLQELHLETDITYLRVSDLA